jgi:hypothetical protein
VNSLQQSTGSTYFNSIAIANDTIAVAGYFNGNNLGSNDILLAKYNTNAVLQSVKTGGGTGDDQANSVVANGTGFIVSGTIGGASTIDGVRFLPPVELKVMPNLSAPENKTYNSGSGSLRYLQDGQLTFGIYDAQLVELNVEISYGDYVGYPVTETEIRYFSVVNDGVKNYDNKHTIMGYKGAFRTVVCATIENNEFRGL